MTDPTFERVALAVARTFRVDPASVTPATEASDVPGWDSLSHVYLVMAIEDDLGVRLPLAELAACENVGELASLAGRSPPR